MTDICELEEVFVIMVHIVEVCFYLSFIGFWYIVYDKWGSETFEWNTC